MANNQEKFKVWWDEEEKVIRVRVSGTLAVSEAKALVKDLNSFIKASKEKGMKHIDSVTDVVDVKMPNTDRELREVFIGFFKQHDFSSGISVIFGVNALAKIVINFISGFGGTPNLRFFESENEAIEWLRKARKERDK